MIAPRHRHCGLLGTMVTPDEIHPDGLFDIVGIGIGEGLGCTDPPALQTITSSRPVIANTRPTKALTDAGVSHVGDPFT